MENITEHLIGVGPQLLLEGNTTYNLFAGIVIESLNDHAVRDIGETANDVSFNIDGIIRSPGTAISLTDVFGYNINIGTSGRISGGQGIALSSVEDASVINNGTIIADFNIGAGVRLYGDSANGSITNSSTGTILSSFTGIYVDPAGLLTNATVVNEGLIIGQSIGVFYNSAGSFTNSGTIISEVGTGVSIIASGASYLNTGTIISQASDGIAVDMFNAEGIGIDTLFHNSGLISGAMAFSSLDANDTFWNSGANAQIIGDVDMGAGNDTFRNFSVNSIHYDIHGGEGGDSLYGGSGAERFHGDDGNDYFELGSGDDVAYGGAGEDIVFAQGGNDTIYGGEGDDIIHGNTGNDKLYGNAGLDELYGGAGNDTLSGGSSTDFLYGSIGHDTLIGGSGADALYGGPGADLLIGGAGLDLFYMLGFFGDDDVIADFSQADGDIIVLNASTADSLIDVLEASINVNGNTFVDFGTNQSFTIEGIRPAELMADDFLFDGFV